MTPRSNGARATFSSALFAAAFAAAPVAAIEIDGRLDPGEWDQARHVTDFLMVQPLTGVPDSRRRRNVHRG